MLEIFLKALLSTLVEVQYVPNTTCYISTLGTLELDGDAYRVRSVRGGTDCVFTLRDVYTVKAGDVMTPLIRVK